MVNSVCENGEKLKFLTLDGSKSKTKMLDTLLDSCRSLEDLNLECFSFFSSKRIKSLCFKIHLTLQKVDFSSCYGLNLESIKLIVDNCVEIKDLRLTDSQLSKKSLHYLVNNLTIKIEELSLKWQINLHDSHILNLVQGSRLEVCFLSFSRFLTIASIQSNQYFYNEPHIILLKKALDFQ